MVHSGMNSLFSQKSSIKVYSDHFQEIASSGSSSSSTITVLSDDQYIVDGLDDYTDATTTTTASTCDY